MGRYILFTGCRYYPNGGWEDYKVSSDEIGILKDRFKELKNEYLAIDEFWGHIVDTQTFAIVWESGEESHSSTSPIRKDVIVGYDSKGMPNTLNVNTPWD